MAVPTNCGWVGRVATPAGLRGSISSTGRRAAGRCRRSSPIASNTSTPASFAQPCRRNAVSVRTPAPPTCRCYQVTPAILGPPSRSSPGLAPDGCRKPGTMGARAGSSRRVISHPDFAGSTGDPWMPRRRGASQSRSAAHPRGGPLGARPIGSGEGPRWRGAAGIGGFGLSRRATAVISSVRTSFEREASTRVSAWRRVGRASGEERLER